MRPEPLKKETGQTDGLKNRFWRGRLVPALEHRTAGNSPAQERTVPLPACTHCEQQSVQIVMLPYYFFISSASWIGRSWRSAFPNAQRTLWKLRETNMFNRPVNLESSPTTQPPADWRHPRLDLQCSHPTAPAIASKDYLDSASDCW